MKKNLIIGLIVIVIILAGEGVWYLQSAIQPPPASLKAVSLCPCSGLESTLLWVAKDQGYYAEHGLNVTFKEYPTGVIATQDIFNGKLDFLLTTEYIISEPLLNKKPLWVIGTIAESDIMSVIGRRDKGIERIPDLELKKIGVARNTMAEYFLGRFFTLNGLSLRNATVINLQPAELVNALVWDPYVFQIQQQMGGNTVVWPANLGQHAYFSIVCNETLLQEKPQIIEGLLASLLQAETFVNSYNEEAKKIAQQQTNFDDQYMDQDWQNHHFSVGLSQSLITSMEDETRWRICNNMTAVTDVPDFSNYISSDTLYRLKPSAVTIIR